MGSISNGVIGVESNHDMQFIKGRGAEVARYGVDNLIKPEKHDVKRGRGAERAIALSKGWQFDAFSKRQIAKNPVKDWVFKISGGADGTRTRDPRRDRPVF